MTLTANPQVTPPEPSTSPARSRRRPLVRFLAAVVITAAIVLGAGWFTGLRHVIHGALLAVAMFAFLPLVLVLAGIAIALLGIAFSLIASLFGNGGDLVATDAGLAEIGVQAAPGYYRFMAARFVARRKHPVFWGVPLGALCGAMLLWAVLGTRVIPGETRSAETIVDIQARVEAAYARTSRYPAPTAEGHLLYESLGDGGPGTGVVRDGFGRPLEYRKTGHWKVASYVLRSYGYDGRPGGGDDLCRSGATKLGRWSEAIRIGRDPDGSKAVSVSVKLGALRESQCPDDE